MRIPKINILIVFFAFFAFSLKFYHKIYFISSTLIILITLFMTLFFINKQSLLSKKNINVYIVFTIIISLQLFSYFWTNSINYGISKILYFSLWIITFIFYTEIINNNYKIVLKANFFIGIFYVLLIFLEYGSPLEIISSMDKFTRLGHSDDQSTNPIVIARYLGFFVITLFFIFNKKNILLNFIVLFFIIIAIVFIFLTGSKGIILSLFLILFLFIIKVNLKYFSYTFLSLGFICLLFILFIDFDSLLRGSKLYQFIEYRFLNSNHNSYSTREDQFYFAYISFINGTFPQQLFGHGIGNFGIAYLGVDERYYPHNIFLEILYENGLISLSIFLYIILYMIKALFKVTANDGYLLYLIVCYYYFLFNAFVSGDIYENIGVFLFFILFSDVHKRNLS